MKRKGLFILLVFICVGLFGCAKTKATDVFRFEVRELELTIGDEKELDLIRGDIDEDATIVYTMYKLNNAGEYEEDFNNLIVECQGSLSTNYDNDSTKGLKDVVKVIGLKEGQIRFTAYVKESPNITDSIIINVNKKVLNALKINADSDTVYIGDTLQLSIETFPNDEDITKDVIYSINDPTVASINKDGIITGIKTGAVIVTAVSVHDNTLSAKKTIYVSYNSATSVELNNSNITIENGESFQLTANVSPATAENKVSYASSDTTVVTVDDKGLITSVNGGSAIITVTSSDSKAFSTASVTVTYPEPTALVVTPITNIDYKKTANIEASVTPANASQEVVVEIISGTAVTCSGLRLTAAEIGSATVKVSTANGSFSQEFVVTVDYAEPIALSVTTTKNTLNIDDELQLTATVSPAGAKQGLTFVSNDPTILTVSETGLVKAIKAGTTTITIKEETNKFNRDYEITVYEKPTALVVTNAPEATTININEIFEFDLEVAINPEGALQTNFKVEVTERIAKYEISGNTVTIVLDYEGELTIKISVDGVEDWTKTYTLVMD